MKALRLLSRLMSKSYFWHLFIVVLFGCLASIPLFGSGYFNMHDDLQMMRSLQMEKCFLDGQIPCRWVPDMGYGYGFPLFNFYPPLPYLVGMLIRLVGFSFVDTAKGLFILAFIVSGITMYFFAKEFFGKIGGVLASVFYIWAPYHAVDVYVRGALNEAWALIWFPVILLLSYKLIINKKPHYSLLPTVYLSLSLFALLTSHNLMALIFAPVFGVWCLIWIVKEKSWQKIPHLIAAGLLSLGLAAFFTFPVIMEQKFVSADTLIKGYYEYTAHFATINQILFSRFWGYGGSVWMDANDKMSFQVGHIHWILSLIVLVLCIYKFIKTRKLNNLLLVTCYFIAVSWAAAFMMHTRSIEIWQLVKQLQFVQFPWRFLALVILGFSFAVGAIAKLLPKKLAFLLSLTLILTLTLFNWEYFKTEHGKLGEVTDEQKFSGVAWDLQRNAGILDYLPKTAKENPLVGQSTVADVVEGDAQILNPKQGTDWAGYELDVTSNKAKVRTNIFMFPNWKVFIDDKETNVFIPEEEKNGRMYIEVPEGRHEVYAKLYNTPIRTISNIISLASWLFLVFVILKYAKKII